MSLLRKGTLVRLVGVDPRLPELLRGYYGEVVGFWDNGYDREGYKVHVFLGVPDLTLEVPLDNAFDLSPDAAARLRYFLTHEDDAFLPYQKARQKLLHAVSFSGLSTSLQYGLGILTYPSLEAVWMHQDIKRRGLSREQVEEKWQRLKAASNEAAEALFDYVGI